MQADSLHTPGPESLLSEGVAPALERESKVLEGSAGWPAHSGSLFLQKERTEGKCAPCAAGGLQLWAGAEGLRGASEEGARDEALQNGVGGVGGGVNAPGEGALQSKADVAPPQREQKRGTEPWP